MWGGQDASKAYHYFINIFKLKMYSISFFGCTDNFIEYLLKKGHFC